MDSKRVWLVAIPVLAFLACSAPVPDSLERRRQANAANGDAIDDGNEENGTDEDGPENEVQPTPEPDDEPDPDPPSSSADAGAAPAPAQPDPNAKAIACPTDARISQGFSGSHDGIDLANARGTPIFATAAGVVTASGPAQGYGQWIRVKHDDGSMTEYGHMFQRDVAVGQRVTAGQRIALMGSEGQSSGPHLHLRTYQSADRVGAGNGMNPVDYLKQRGLTLPCKP